MVQDNVAVVVIGSTSMGATMVPIITKAGIPYVSVTGSAAQELTTPGTFMWSGGYEATLTGFAKYAAQHGYKKVTAFVVDIPSEPCPDRSVAPRVVVACVRRGSYQHSAVGSGHIGPEKRVLDRLNIWLQSD